MAAAKLRQHLREAAVASGPALAHYKRRQRKLAERCPGSPLLDAKALAPPVKRSRWDAAAREAQSRRSVLFWYKRRQRRLAELDPDSPFRDKSIDL